MMTCGSSIIIYLTINYMAKIKGVHNVLTIIKKLLILSSLFVLTACGSDNNEEPETDTSDHTQIVNETEEEVAEDTEEVTEVDKTENEEVEEEPEEPIEEVAEEEPASASETSEYQWLYDELNGKSFIFSSGAGAWRTIIEMTSDGQFTGHYSDADGMNLSVTEFTGQFKINQEIDEYTYRMRLENFQVTSPTGTHEQDGNMMITYVDEPHGFQSGSSVFELYLPFKPKSQVSDEYLSWVSGQSYNERENLNSFGIYNLMHEFGMEEYFYQ